MHREPVDTVVSFLIPDGIRVRENIVGHFCHFVHFFSLPAVAEPPNGYQRTPKRSSSPWTMRTPSVKLSAWSNITPDDKPERVTRRDNDDGGRHAAHTI